MYFSTKCFQKKSEKWSLSCFAVNSIKSVFLSEIGSGHRNSHFTESFKWAGGMPNIRNEWVRRRDHQRGVLEESSQKLISKMNSHSYLRMYVNSTFFLATCLACILELLLTASTIYHILVRHFYFGFPIKSDGICLCRGYLYN